MKVWMTIGYTDYEGDSNCDKVFVNKEKAVDHILGIVADMWSSPAFDKDANCMVKLVREKYKRDEFIAKTKEYILNFPDKSYDHIYWYFWSGSDFWTEIFPDWDEDAFTGTWVGLECVELNEEN